MQLKRLEEAVGVSLIDRRARTVALTGSGEQLLGYARRMLELNDEALGRLTDETFEGEIVLGVPHDIVYPAIPEVLHRFATDYPRMRVQLVSSYTRRLRSLFERGGCDLILTTEDGCDAGGETLARLPLVWLGAPGGAAWKGRPLALAFEQGCIFRQGVQRALDAAGIRWVMSVESDSSRTIEASVSADLAVTVALEGTELPVTERIPHGGALPDLSETDINLYVSGLARGRPVEALSEIIRSAFRHRRA
jgi:DNA-binding transcriptional LysR family regulator